MCFAPATSIRCTVTIVLDMDSSVSPTYGDQETAYNGHFLEAPNLAG